MWHALASRSFKSFVIVFMDLTHPSVPRLLSGAILGPKLFESVQELDHLIRGRYMHDGFSTGSACDVYAVPWTLLPATIIKPVLRSLSFTTKAAVMMPQLWARQLCLASMHMAPLAADMRSIACTMPLLANAMHTLSLSHLYGGSLTMYKSECMSGISVGQFCKLLSTNICRGGSRGAHGSCNPRVRFFNHWESCASVGKESAGTPCASKKVFNHLLLMRPSCLKYSLLNTSCCGRKSCHCQNFRVQCGHGGLWKSSPVSPPLLPAF